MFLLVDLLDFFFRFMVGGRKKKKTSENDQSTGHFRFFFLIFPEQTVN